MGIRRWITFEGCAAFALGVAVFAFALGSSSVTSWHQFGSHAKWLALAALVPISFALAYLKRSSRRPAPALYLLAGLFLVLAFTSAFWSVDPGRTVKVAISLALLFAVCAALGLAATRPAVGRALVTGLLGGAVAVAVAGFVLYFVHRHLAMAPRDPEGPERFQGITENPNTVSLLCALVLPLALWKTVSSSRPGLRPVAGVWLLLLYGTIVLSGSKGALVAAFVGTALFALTFHGSYRPRLLLLLAVAIGFVAPVVLLAVTLTPAKVVSAGLHVAPVTRTLSSGVAASAPARIPRFVGAGPRLSDEFDAPTIRVRPTRTLFGTSGRAQAWVAAIRTGLDRPIAGYGFGTEDRAFVDRLYFFQGNRPENSFVGSFLQLGLAGPALLLLIVISLLASGRRTLRSSTERPLQAACLGVVAAGAVLACVQSYIYAVGDIGTLAFWSSAVVLAGMIGPGAPTRRLPRNRMVGLGLGLVAVLVLAIFVGRHERATWSAKENRGIAAMRAEVGVRIDHPLAFRQAPTFACLLYAKSQYLYRLELCFAPTGAIVEAIHRREGHNPEVWSLRSDPEAATVRESPRVIAMLLEQLGAQADATEIRVGYSDNGAFAPNPAVKH